MFDACTTCLLLPLPPELALEPRSRRLAPAVVLPPPADAPLSSDVAFTPLPPAEALPPDAALSPPMLAAGSLALPSVDSGMVQVPVVKVMLMPGPAHHTGQVLNPQQHSRTPWSHALLQLYHSISAKLRPCTCQSSVPV